MQELIMNSPSSRSSPTFRNIKIKQKQSPIEIREKLRKSYKEKIHSSRNLIFNSLRGNFAENNLQTTLNDIYKAMFNFNEEFTSEEEEQLLEEIKKDLVEEELNWWLAEYEKCHDNIDLSTIEAEEVICPVCQKSNLFQKTIDTVFCLNCESNVKTQKSLTEIKRVILECIDSHNNECKNEVQFNCVPEADESHIYLICDTCNDMRVVF